ncbi:hypothetical protein Q8G41_28545, partial [Klebsiella pneumoniae]|uniref:hypothetical protein n=1 Tax=Klebsiella pneumoniae TaxID=573 RepID=UPI003013DFE8
MDIQVVEVEIQRLDNSGWKENSGATCETKTGEASLRATELICGLNFQMEPYKCKGHGYRGSLAWVKQN